MKSNGTGIGILATPDRYGLLGIGISCFLECESVFRRGDLFNEVIAVLVSRCAVGQGAVRIGCRDTDVRSCGTVFHDDITVDGSGFIGISDKILEHIA